MPGKVEEVQGYLHRASERTWALTLTLTLTPALALALGLARYVPTVAGPIRIVARLDGKRLDAALASLLPPLGRSYFSSLCSDGMVLVQGAAAKKALTNPNPNPNPSPNPIPSV